MTSSDEKSSDEKTYLKPNEDPDGVRYPSVYVPLVGEDGNAFSIMGRVSQALRRANVSPEEIKLYQKESMSGNYDNLLRTVTRWVNEGEKPIDDQDD